MLNTLAPYFKFIVVVFLCSVIIVLCFRLFMLLHYYHKLKQR